MCSDTNGWMGGWTEDTQGVPSMDGLTESLSRLLTDFFEYVSVYGLWFREGATLGGRMGESALNSGLCNFSG